MIVHFQNRQAALAHLTTKGWTKCKTGQFVSYDGTMTASIHPGLTRSVAVYFWHINGGG
jgi:hypothetical protein